MKRDYLKHLATTAALLLVAGSVNAHDVEIDGIYYNLVSKAKQATVTYRGESYDAYGGEYSGSVTIPSTVVYEGVTYDVTSIGEYAFFQCSDLTSVTIPEGVTSIGERAFHVCSGLTSVTIPSSVTNIEISAFFACRGLTSVTIPEGVTSIGSSAFNGCSGLTSVTIPSSVTRIESGVFASCSALTSVSIPEGVTTIGANAFASCSSLISVTIPLSVSTIASFAFQKCSSIISVSIPSSVTSIGNGAFKGCSALTSVTIPPSVTSIETGTFQDCTSLTSMDIPLSVTVIEGSAFSGCSGLTSVTIPLSVTSIGDGAFSGCSSLTSVTIPSSVTGIGSNAFWYCTGLTSVTIEGSPNILQRTFYNCSKLTTITLNGSSIASQAFANCPELLDVYCNSELSPSVESDAFEGSYIDYVILHVPAAGFNAYVADPVWGSFKEIVTFEPIVVHATIELTDGESFEGLGLNRDMESITYTRTFSNTNWQALYVPFTMEYSEWTTDFDIARINDIHQFDDDDNGMIDRTELEVIRVTSGSIEANTPYLIRAKEAGEKTFTLANRTLYKAEEKSYTVSSWNTLFTFTGTYSGVTGSDMISNAYYALGDGALRQAASTDNALSPYRWYVAITDRNGAQKGVNEVKLKVWGEDATSLTPLSVSPEGEKTAVYDLSGRRIAKENATKGLYIVNGKKVMVR